MGEGLSVEEAEAVHLVLSCQVDDGITHQPPHDSVTAVEHTTRPRVQHRTLVAITPHTVRCRIRSGGYRSMRE